MFVYYTSKFLLNNSSENPEIYFHSFTKNTNGENIFF